MHVLAKKRSPHVLNLINPIKIKWKWNKLKKLWPPKKTMHTTRWGSGAFRFEKVVLRIPLATPHQQCLFRLITTRNSKLCQLFRDGVVWEKKNTSQKRIFQSFIFLFTKWPKQTINHKKVGHYYFFHNLDLLRKSRFLTPLCPALVGRVIVEFCMQFTHVLISHFSSELK